MLLSNNIAPGGVAGAVTGAGRGAGELAAGEVMAGLGCAAIGLGSSRGVACGCDSPAGGVVGTGRPWSSWPAGVPVVDGGWASEGSSLGDSALVLRVTCGRVRAGSLAEPGGGAEGLLVFWLVDRGLWV